MLTAAQEQKILLLSDTVLYPEASVFLRRLMDEKECSPLAKSQVTGLFNIIGTAHYGQLTLYIHHQKIRDWPPSKGYNKTFYEELEKFMVSMRSKRLREEFRLLPSGLSKREENQLMDELMEKLMAEFIQHLIAENELVKVNGANRNEKSGDQRAKFSSKRR